ncbi:hypothetical protein [Planomicrobium okeanokoites]|uniref:hypothetical protein n=1 Tax=Planomicrobium okeanokoites TaxID=244 RepID=UPI0024905E1E|nr:hypothetical protein [Planomicrobium okeanokoites]
MDKIYLNEEVISKHYSYCLGNDKNKKKCCYFDLENEKKTYLTSNPLIYRLLANIQDNFEDIIKGKPQHLVLIYNKFLDLFNEITQELSAEEKEETRTKINEVLKNVFIGSYERFSSRLPGKSNLWGAYNFCANLNTNICPYCNSQFIITYIGKNGKTRPTIDHFFSKERFPLFAVSIFNLIPSCKICNSDFKGTEEMNLNEHIHPYIESFNELAIFKRKLSENSGIIDYYSVLVGKGEDFDIIVEDRMGSTVEQKNKVKNTKKVFNTEEIYHYHKKYVQELIIKSIIYTEAYKQNLLYSYERLFANEEQIIQLLMPKDINNHILSKITIDILEEEFLKKKNIFE